MDQTRTSNRYPLGLTLIALFFGFWAASGVYLIYALETADESETSWGIPTVLVLLFLGDLIYGLVWRREWAIRSAEFLFLLGSILIVVQLIALAFGKIDSPTWALLICPPGLVYLRIFHDDLFLSPDLS
jgi:peptidoglycan/LPS O-acetylase OafA/YrhL